MSSLDYCLQYHCLQWIDISGINNSCKRNLICWANKPLQEEYIEQKHLAYSTPYPTNKNPPFSLSPFPLLCTLTPHPHPHPHPTTNHKLQKQKKQLQTKTPQRSKAPKFQRVITKTPCLKHPPHPIPSRPQKQANQASKHP